MAQLLKIKRICLHYNRVVLERQNVSIPDGITKKIKRSPQKFIINSRLNDNHSEPINGVVYLNL